MSTDVRDEALGRALDGAVADLPSAADRLAEVRRRGATRRTIRTAALVAAVVVFAGAVGAAALDLSGRHDTPGSAITWSVWRDAGVGVQFRYPSSWHLTTFEHICNPGDFSGAMVANAPGAYQNPASKTECHWPPYVRNDPPGIVALAVDRMAGGPPVHPGEEPDTRLPLSLDGLSPAPPGTPLGARRPVPERQER